jgi:hypothetical protein
MCEDPISGATVRRAVVAHGPVSAPGTGVKNGQGGALRHTVLEARTATARAGDSAPPLPAQGLRARSERDAA